MDISSLINSLPPFGDKEKTVFNALVSYGGWITNDPAAKENLSTENIQEIDELIREILKSYEYFQTGQIAKSYKTIYNIIFSDSYTHKIFNTFKIESESFLYRMRQSDNEYLFSSEELFHVPFHERQKISNQRFSLTGYPCLYLGKSIYVCWEELNRPRFDNANIGGLKTLRPIHLLDLRMPTQIKGVDDFYLIPLIIASSVKVQEPKLPFKPEYIISQAILHAIIAHNNSVSSPNNLNGIIYYSSTVNSNQRLFDDLELFENIIVPTVNNITDPNAEKIYYDGFCPVLCNIFEITNPVSFNTYQLRKNIKNKFIHSATDVDKPYTKTQMGVLEEHVKRLNTNKIVPNKFFRLHPDLLKKY